MATVILAVKSFATSPLVSGSTLASLNTFTPSGDADTGVCYQTASDAKTAGVNVPGADPGHVTYFFFNDPGSVSLPAAASIDSVKFTIRHRATTANLTANPASQPVRFFALGSGATIPYADLVGGDPYTFAYQVNNTAVLTVNPGTGIAWTRSDLFPTGTGGTENLWRVIPTGSPYSYDIDQITLVVTYTAAWYYNPVTDHYAYGGDPGDPWVANTPTTAVDDTNVPTDITDDVEDPLIDPATEDDDNSGNIPDADSLVPVLFTPGIGCSAGGTSVAITGTGFGDSATVTFGGVAATSVVVVNSKLITAVTPAHADGAVNVVVTNADTTTATGTGAFTYGTPWWTQFIIVIIDSQIYTFEFSVQSCSPPDTGVWVLQSITTPIFTWWLNSSLGISAYQVSSPGTGWTDVGAAATPASNNGWYISPVAFGGSIQILSASRPKDPRTWENIIVWAEGGTEMLGGSPAASCIFNNHIVYPSSDYTVGTTYPPIRVFDGSFDHELCKLPPTPTNGVPQAVLSMLAANGTMYLTSFDSGTTSANWLGRAFQLDLNSGVLTPLGTQFAAGEMPYALCWHMGRLWCGTNNGIGTVGKVYYFRPGIDTTWTLDHSLATDSVGGVDSMVSYKGLLYVGSDGAAATFAKVMVRSALGVYTQSTIASGGTARVNNGFLAMREFGGNLYASYWNNDTTAVSLIQKFDNTSWSTVYTPTGANIRPFIVLFEDDSQLFAIGGGFDLTGALVSTPNGTTWTSLTAQLASVESSKTLLPMYGVEIL